MTADLVEVRLDADGVAERILIRAGLVSRPGDEVRDLIIAADMAAALELAPPDDAIAETPGPETLTSDETRTFYEAGTSEESPTSSETTTSNETPTDAGSGSARDLAELVNRAMTAFDRAGTLTGSLTDAMTGAATSMTDDPVRMTLSCGRITDVVIDGRWLSRTAAPEVAAELDRALVTARATYERSQQSVAELNQDLANLLADVKATLQMFAEKGPA